MPAQNIFSRFLNPTSIAIVGASRSPEKIGYQIIKNLVVDGYRGSIYPINPNATTIQQLKCYPTLAKIPKAVDLAIIVVPAPLVSTIIAECAQNHIKNAIIISAGFAEAGPKGQQLQVELYQTLQKYPVAVVGPNCLGCLSPVNRVNAAFGPRLPKAGNVMLISQSGALVTGILDWTTKMDIGLSHAVTFGNRLGVGELEALEYAAHDQHTKIILTYLESFQNAPLFFSKCSQITPHKPILLLKGGQSAIGQKASASHTAALASNYTLVKALAKQTGVIIVDTIDQWLQLAAAFVRIPPAKSRALTILTNAGGPGVLSTDEATALDLELPELSAATKARILHALPHLNPHNPLDILGDASPEQFSTALSILEKDNNVHNLLTIITPQAVTHPTQVATVIANSTIHKTIPSYSVFIGGEKVDPAKEILDKAHLLNYDFPSDALNVIANKTLYESEKKQITHYPAQCYCQ